MPSVQRDAERLVSEIRAVCLNPHPGVVPWHGQRLLDILERADRHSPDHGAFYQAFIEGVRDLVIDEEDVILRRFTSLSLPAEARVTADDLTQRDHLTHVSQVYLLGWLILHRCAQFSCPDEDWAPYGWSDAGGNPGHRFEKLNRGWLYAALLHDCAYSVEKAAQALGHEQRIQALFGNLYIPAAPGRFAGASTTREIRELWRKRAEWIGYVTPPPAAAAVMERQVGFPDHGLVAGVALWREAEGATSPIADVLRPAAVAVACHNLQYHVDPRQPPGTELNSWCRLDFDQEPLGALLHLCDVLQEWSRERADEALAYLQERCIRRFANTELTYVDVEDRAGITLSVRMLRRLHAGDRPRARRLAREHERDIAETSRRLRVLFRPRTQRAEFHLHLRVDQTLDDTRCANALSVDWPPTGAGLIEQLDAGWRARPSAGVHLQPARAVVTPGRHGGEFTLDTTGHVCVPGGPESLRLAVVGWGGQGKSTLLQAVARAGSRKRKPLYVEELPAESGDIEPELRSLRERFGAEILLLVDHLDRLDESETCEFWVDQLANLPSDTWLQVVVACRPDEFERIFAGGLRGYVRLDLVEPRSPITDGDSDPDGRPRARAVARQICAADPRAARRIGRVAFSMGSARAMASLSVDQLAGVTFRGGPALVRDASGHIRFAHDVVQDFLTADYLASELATHAALPDRCRAIVRSIMGLPRDVPRMLFDLLATGDGGSMTRERCVSAARALGRAMLREHTTRHWLFHADRYRTTAHAVRAYGQEFDEAEARALTDTLLGHKEFGDLIYSRIVSDAVQVEHAQTAVTKFCRAGRWAEEAISAAADEDERRAHQTLLLKVADHVMSTLCHVAGACGLEVTARDLAGRAGAELRVDHRASALEPGWLGHLLSRFGSAPGQDERIALLLEVDQTTESMDSVPGGHGGPVWLAVARAHLAAHIATRYAQHADFGPADLARMDLCRRWQYKCIARLERIARDMERYPFRQDIERYASPSQVRADASWHHSLVFESWLFAAASMDAATARDRLLEAHWQQEAAWLLARAVLGPGERLQVFYPASIPMRATGSVLAGVLRNPCGKDEIRQRLEATAEQMLAEAGMIAERNPRGGNEAAAPVEVFSRYRAAIGQIDSLAGLLYRVAQ